MKMKLIFLVGFIAIFAGAFAYEKLHMYQVQTAAPVQKEKVALVQAPKVSLQTLNGQKFDSFHDVPAEKILVNFWATWCAPCLKELPDLIDIASNSKGKVALVAVSIDDKPEKIEKFLGKIDVNLNEKNVYWVWDEGRQISLEAFHVVRVPETIILDKNRNMVDKVVGVVDWKTYLKAN